MVVRKLSSVPLIMMGPDIGGSVYHYEIKTPIDGTLIDLWASILGSDVASIAERPAKVSAFPLT